MSRDETNYLGYVSHNANDIINRAKQVLNLKTDTDLANILGIKPNTISGWRSRNSIDYNLLLSKMGGVNVHWLVTGEGRKDFQDDTDIISEPDIKYGVLPDPLVILDKMKKIDPERLKTILELIDLYSRKE